MDGLTAPEYEGLMAIAKAALDADGEPGWMELVATLLLGVLLHADVVAFADIRFGRLAGMFGMIRPAWAELAVPTGSPMHEDLVANHPLTWHLAGRDALEVVRVSDIVGQRSWENMVGYVKMRELIGATNQLSIALDATPARSYSLSPIRAGADFTDHEVEVAQRLQPLLIAADRHVSLVRQFNTSSSPTQLQASIDAATAYHLTARERVVLNVMAEGVTAGEVARRLKVSARTISKHQENIYRKLGVADRLSAVLRAQHSGLIAGGDRQGKRI